MENYTHVVDTLYVIERGVEDEDFLGPLPIELREQFADLDISLSAEEIIDYFGADIEPDEWFIDEPVYVEDDYIQIHCKSNNYPDPELWDEICKRYKLRLSMFAMYDDPKYYYTENRFEFDVIVLFINNDDLQGMEDYDFTRDYNRPLEWYWKSFHHFDEAVEFVKTRKYWTMVKPSEPYMWGLISDEEFERDYVYSIEELNDLGWEL